jgi:flagellar protein FlaG
MSAMSVGATATPALMQTAGTLPDRGSASLRVTSPTATTVAAAPRPSQIEQSTAPSREVVDQAARRIEDFVKSVGRSLSFSVESGTGHSVLRVVNPNSGEVIRQLPAEETMRIARSIDYLQSVLVNQRA